MSLYCRIFRSWRWPQSHL